MHQRSGKVRVNTLRELKIQKALGHDAVMCIVCGDTGTCTERNFYDVDTWNCVTCEMGWKYIMRDWMEKIENSFSIHKCTIHKDYCGCARPTVLCDACWKIWFAAPKKSEDLVQNVE